MSNDLNIPQLVEGQASPEVTANDATAALGNALANKFDCDLTSGNVTVTAAQYRGAVLLRAMNATTTGRTITVPQVEREFLLVEADSANTKTVALIRGSTTLTLWPGRVYLIRTDGTANGLAAKDIGGASAPFDLGVFLPGLMLNAQNCFHYVCTTEFTLPVGLTGSYFDALTAATASTTLTIKKNGTNIGTVVWGVGGTVGAATFTGAIAFIPGDKLDVVGPGTADATLADIALDFHATR